MFTTTFSFSLLQTHKHALLFASGFWQGWWQNHQNIDSAACETTILGALALEKKMKRLWVIQVEGRGEYLWNSGECAGEIVWVWEGNRDLWAWREENLQKYLWGAYRQVKSWSVSSSASPLIFMPHRGQDSGKAWDLRKPRRFKHSQLHGNQCTVLTSHLRGSVLWKVSPKNVFKICA